MAHRSPLPAFSFPALPESSSHTTIPQSHSDRSSSNLSTQPHKSHHRRNIAQCLKRSSVTLYSSTPTSDSSIPPVPKIPERYSQSSLASPVIGSQPLIRSLSDVSTCPTLVTDAEPDTPESLQGFGDPDEFFSKLSLEQPLSKVPSNEPKESEEAYDGDESNASEVDLDDTDDDDDDDEEFWHCRGLYDPSSPSIDQSHFEQQKKDSDGFAPINFPIPRNSTIDSYDSYENWLSSVAYRAQLFDEMSKGYSTPNSRDFDDYMGIIRFPLLA